jgi:putative transposase
LFTGRFVCKFRNLREPVALPDESRFNALEQQLQAGPVGFPRARFRPVGDEKAGFETLGPQAETRAIPVEDLHLVGSPVEEDEQLPAQGVLSQRLARQRIQAIEGIAQGESIRKLQAVSRQAHDYGESREVCGVACGGYIKGKSAIHLARVYGEHKRNFVGQSFWARGYFVSTVGRDETLIREYIRDQEQEDKRLDQLSLWR